MKDLSKMTFSECLLYVRKSSKEYNTQPKLALKSRIPRGEIGEFERGEKLPTLAQLEAISVALECPQLREKGENEIEYIRTHPNVRICFSDRTRCWRCGELMCSVYGLVNDSTLSPDFFTEEMLQISRAKGVLLEERRSGVTGETHLVNVCPHCGTFIGEFYLHDLWYGETETIQVEDVKSFITDK